MRRCRAAPVDAAPIVAKETRLDKGLPPSAYPRLPSRPGLTEAAPYSDRHRRLPPSVTTFPICFPGGK